MPDDPTKQPPRDPNRINIHEHGEVLYWCKRLNCTRAQLVVAVHTVGPIMALVASFLREAVPPTKLQAMSVRKSVSPPTTPSVPPEATG